MLEPVREKKRVRKKEAGQLGDAPAAFLRQYEERG